MKKVVFVLLVVFIAVSCGSKKISQSYLLEPGMTKKEVMSILGAPTKSDFDRNVEEWHYCKTGLMSDEYLALFFHDGVLVTKTNYTVMQSDVPGMAGTCDKFIKMGNYKVPDVVVEIRSR